jgi:ATP-binding cassette subfamily C protein
MAHEPSLLILDDPFAGLDTIGCRFILNLIKRHRDAGGVAVIATAPHFAKVFADKAMTIVSGRMQAFGSPDQVFKVQQVGLTQAQLSSESAMG